jgi:hypothetical protein
LATFCPLTSPELIDQLRQLQQIRHAEERTGFAYDYFRIWGNEIGPLRRNRADARIVDL